MSSWLSVPACWWLSFCFTSSSPVATHPKRPYSLVINIALSQPGSMFPNTLALQVNLCAATFGGLNISKTFARNKNGAEWDFLWHFQSCLEWSGWECRKPLPRPATAARGRHTSGAVTLVHNLQISAFGAFAVLCLSLDYRQQNRLLSLRDLTSHPPRWSERWGKLNQSAGKADGEDVSDAHAKSETTQPWIIFQKSKVVEHVRHKCVPAALKCLLNLTDIWKCSRCSETPLMWQRGCALHISAVPLWLPW